MIRENEQKLIIKIYDHLGWQILSATHFVWKPKNTANQLYNELNCDALAAIRNPKATEQTKSAQNHKSYYST